MNATSKNARPDSRTGSFEIADVAPGDYELIGMASEHMAMQEVHVVASDVENVDLVITAGAHISARLITDGKAAAAAQDLDIVLGPFDGSMIFVQRHSATQQKDGSYEWKAVNDGTYTVRVVSKCEECYLKSATANGVDVLEHGLQVAGGRRARARRSGLQQRDLYTERHGNEQRRTARRGRDRGARAGRRHQLGA